MEKKTKSSTFLDIYPRAFLARRLHSLTGLFIALFLFFHLFTNSQAALFLGKGGQDFVHSVNDIHSLPYLPLIEIALLGVPILIHMLWGVLYLKESKYNNVRGEGSKPSLPQYSRNQAFTWQRITAIILVFGLILHVGHMRFYARPVAENEGNKTFYQVDVENEQEAFGLDVQLVEDKGRLYAKASDFGTALLLVMRNTFQSPLMIFLYTLFVLVACFHGFNGLWTFLISWGIILSPRSQKMALRCTNGLMIVVILLGLMAIYGN